MKQASRQEEQVLNMIKKSTSLFPERKDFSKFNDAAIGWAHLKRKTNPKLNVHTDSMRFSTGQTVSQESPRASQKKAVRVMLNEPDGGVKIEPASPTHSQSRRKTLLIQSASVAKETVQDGIESPRLPTQVTSSRSQSLKFPQIAMTTTAAAATKPKVQPKKLSIQVHEMHVTRNIAGARTEDSDPMNAQIRTARNIIDLDRKFQTVYHQGQSLTSTARSQSLHLNDRVDRKIINIMRKVKTRFNRETHKAKTEDMVARIRHKNALRDRLDNQINLDQSSTDLIELYNAQQAVASSQPQPIGLVSSGFIAEVSQESLLEKDEKEVNNVVQRTQELDPTTFLTESQKYLPQWRHIKAAQPNYQKKMYLAESKPYGGFVSGKKKVNLSAYEPHHLQLEQSPRQQMSLAQRMPVEKPAWERTLPGIVPQRANRKPMTIEESIELGYRKKLDMTGLEAVMQSEDNLNKAIPKEVLNNSGEAGQIMYASAQLQASTSQEKLLAQQRERSVKKLVNIYQTRLKEEAYPSPKANAAKSSLQMAEAAKPPRPKFKV